MISLFVKVDGKLQRFETPYHANFAHEVVEPLRDGVRGTLPARAKQISPILALIQPTDETNEQLVLPL